MKDELGSDVSSDSVQAYRAIMNPPARWPWVLLGVFAMSSTVGLAAYFGTLYANAYNAKLCHDKDGVWVKGTCAAPTIEVKHYQITLPRSDPNNDIPTPPPVVPDNPGPNL